MLLLFFFYFKRCTFHSKTKYQNLFIFIYLFNTKKVYNILFLIFQLVDRKIKRIIKCLELMHLFIIQKYVYNIFRLINL